MDTIGPLPEDKEGNQYILVIIDCFTRFVEIYPTKTVNAQESEENTLGKTCPGKYFAVLDLTIGYHQMELSECSRKYAAFTYELPYYLNKFKERNRTVVTI
jgi:hypothetical protein